MKKIQKLIAFFLVFSMLSSFSSAFALDESVALDPESNVSYSNLPDDIKSLVQNGSYVMYDSVENVYHIVNPHQNTSGRAVQVYAPNGGTYDSYNNLQVSPNDILLSISYIPHDAAVCWVMQMQGQSFLNTLADILGENGAAAAATWAAGKLGVEVASLTVPLAITGAAYTLMNAAKKDAFLKALKSAENAGQGYGIRAETHMYAISNTVAVLYSSWAGVFVSDPHGGATWNPKEYWAGGLSYTLPVA